MTYDDYDQLVLRESQEFATNYTYRPDGLLTNESNGSYALAYEYDTYNRLIRRTETVNNKTFPIEYHYSGSILDTTRYPSLNYTVAYEHNARGFITNVAGRNSNNVSATKAIHRTSPSDDMENEEAVEAGTTHTFTFVNNTTETRRYNQYGMQTQFYLQSVSHICHKESYDYDIRKELLTERNIYSTRRNMNGILFVPSQITYQEYFQYDNLQRLTNYGRTNEGVENPQTVTYDNNGNIVSKTNAGDYVYNLARPYAVKEIVNVPDTNSFSSTLQDIEYTSFIRPQHIIEGKYRVYFDYGTHYERCRMELYENDIKQFTRYYFAGGRYEETLYEECYTSRPSDDPAQGDSNNTNYVLADSIKVVEFTPKLTLKKDIGQLLNTEFVIDTTVLTIKFPRDSTPTHNYYADRILYVDGSPYNATIAYTPDRQNKHYYIHRDRQGSVRHISDAEGSIVASYYYDPWGRQTDIQGSTYAPYDEPLLLLGRGYTGHEHLPWFNLIHMNARLYDPVVGRFLSPDPYVQAPDMLQNFNRYSYCLNNQLMYMDEDKEFIHLIIGYC
jgi:RHS repeat-associated protein